VNVAENKFDADRRVGGRSSRMALRAVGLVLIVMIVFLPSTRFGGDFGFKGLGLLALLAVAAVVIALYRLIAVSDLKKVEMSNPEAVVFAAEIGDSLKVAVKGAASSGRTSPGGFPSAFAVVVDSRGIGFWGGSAEPALKFFTPWPDIVEVVPSEMVVANTKVTGLAIDAKFGDAVVPLELVVRRTPHGLLGSATFDVLQRLAVSVEAKRPAVAVLPPD